MAVGRLFHMIHMTGRVEELEAWYADVFGAKTFLPHHYMPTERRDASLVLVGDSVIEPLGPAFAQPDWADYPLGRFYQRFGAHWHSLAFYTDDVVGLWHTTHDVGIRSFGEGGAPLTSEPRLDPAQPNTALMTHPKDTFTQIEFFDPQYSEMVDQDLRFKDDWDPNWWIENHPLQTPGLAYATIVVSDLERAEQVFVSGLGASLLHRGESELTGTRNIYVQLGDTAIELAQPTAEGTIAAADASTFGNALHAAAFKVLDLDGTEKYLASKGIKTAARDDTTLLADPATTFDVPFRFTTWDVPDGPRTATGGHTGKQA